MTRKWHCMTPNGPKTLLMGILHDIMSCWTTLGRFQRPSGAMWGPHGPRGPLKRPQGGPIWHIVLYYAPEKCFMAIWSHAGTFWVMKSNFGSCRLFIEASFWAMKGHFGS